MTPTGCPKSPQYREGMLVRYRYHATAGVAPAFPFGFGLGYTSFGYADLVVTETGASFTVTNTGERAGSDVAQLYVRRVSPSGVPRPALELKGFAKVSLSPGQGTRVAIAFGERTFRHWDVGSGDWQVESGRVEILVGRSSEEIVLAAAFDVAGTVPAGTPDPALEQYRVGDVRDVPDAAFAVLLGRPVPATDDDPPPFDENSPVYSLASSPSRLMRLLARLVEYRRRAADEKLHPDLDALFIASAPLRALHKMTAGTFTSRSTAAIVRIANGDVLRGLSRLLATWPRERARERRAARAFERAARGEPLPRRRSGGAR